jgi:tellurite resistance protein TerC
MFLQNLGIILQLIFLESVLSIDNATVMGAIVSVLPSDHPVPYPHSLRALQRISDRILGAQQIAALKVGLLGAYLGQGIMLALAEQVKTTPWLKVIGAAYLIKLSISQLARPDQPGEEEFLRARRLPANRFWIVVLNVEVANLAFSLDNVVAAVAVSDILWLVMVGVFTATSISLFAAGIFARLVRREPILEIAAYLVVLNIGVELLLAEFAGWQLLTWHKVAISIATILLCVLWAHAPFLYILRPIVNWVGEGMGDVVELVDWALKPVSASWRLLWGLVNRVWQMARPSHT